MYELITRTKNKYQERLLGLSIKVNVKSSFDNNISFCKDLDWANFIISYDGNRQSIHDGDNSNLEDLLPLDELIGYWKYSGTVSLDLNWRYFQ